MYQEIIVNVIANLVAVVILGFLSICTFIIFFILERQKLLQFFGINSSNPKLSVFVSRLEIKPGGTTGFEPVTQGYFGPGIIRVEYKGALLVRDALRSKFLARLPKGIRDWLGQRSVALLDIDPLIDVSPQNSDEIPSDNLILLGTGIYNLGSKIYLEHSSSCFEYTKNQQGERVFSLRTSGMEGIEMPGRSINRELGIIQRINDTALPAAMRYSSSN